MQEPNFEEVVERMTATDPRYHRDAYFFLRAALDHTQQKVCKKNPTEIRHVSGKELLEGIREFGLETYGPMTLTLLHEWGVRRGEDFGEIVFNMVEIGLLSKTDTDSREDFKGSYDFEEAFRQPFLPSRAAVPSPVQKESAT